MWLCRHTVRQGEEEHPFIMKAKLRPAASLWRQMIIKSEEGGRTVLEALARSREPMMIAHMMIDEIFRNVLPKRGFAIRESQVRLSHEMLDTLAGRKTALFEANTGIEKTYTYLITAIVCKLYLPVDWWIRTNYRNDNHFSMTTPMPVIVSTPGIRYGTIICREHIPFLSRALYESGLLSYPITSVLRKGKGHYICDKRLRHRIRNVNLENKNPIQRDALLGLRTGNIDLDHAYNLSHYDQKRISVPLSCDISCPESGQCRFRRFLEMAMDPAIDIQVCNHHYLLADLHHRQTGKEPLLPNYRAVIIDDAYKLYDAAKQMHISSIGITGDVFEQNDSRRKYYDTRS